jgi:hypothetical protein
MIVLGVNQHEAGYWIDLVNTKTLLKREGCREALAIPQRCGSKLDTNQGVHLGRSERTICKCYLERSSGELNNQGILLILNLSEAISVRDRM